MIPQNISILSQGNPSARNGSQIDPPLIIFVSKKDMQNNFQILGIDNTFNHLFSLNQQELSLKGMVKMVVDKKPGYPCRVSLEDVELGEEVILLPFKHHNTSSPYQASGPIFVRKNAQSAHLRINEIPNMLLHRFLSLRVYDEKGLMIECHTIEGKVVKESIQRILRNTEASYIHIHNAGPGCFNCLVNRAV